MKLEIIKRNDGMYHLFDIERGDFIDYPPLETFREAIAEKEDFYRQMEQLNEDEASEMNGLIGFSMNAF